MVIDNQCLRNAIHKLKSDGIIRTQQDIADKTGFGYTTISDLVNDKHPLSLRFIKSFEMSFGINLNTGSTQVDKSVNSITVSDIPKKDIDKSDFGKNGVLSNQEILTKLVLTNEKLASQNGDLIKILSEHTSIIKSNSDTINNLSYKVTETGEPARKNGMGEAS